MAPPQRRAGSITVVIAVMLVAAACSPVARRQVPQSGHRLRPDPAAAEAQIAWSDFSAPPVAPRARSVDIPVPVALDAGALMAPFSLAVSAPGSYMNVYSDPRLGEADLREAVLTVNPFDQRLWFAVVARYRDEAGRRWFRVLLGTEPNEATGWVRGSEVRSRLVADRIEVDLSKRLLRHWRDGELIHRFKVGIGKPGTPTTPGDFFVWARFPSDPSSAYGSYLLGLSGFSEVLTEWPGGGRMAIHGTDDPSDPGQQVSFGCARVYNRQMLQLRDVPMGTPVTIVL